MSRMEAMTQDPVEAVLDVPKDLHQTITSNRHGLHPPLGGRLLPALWTADTQSFSAFSLCLHLENHWAASGQI